MYGFEDARTVTSEVSYNFTATIEPGKVLLSNTKLTEMAFVLSANVNIFPISKGSPPFHT